MLYMNLDTILRYVTIRIGEYTITSLPNYYTLRSDIMAKDLKGKELPKGITQRKDGRYFAQITRYGKRHVVYDRNLKDIKKKLADLSYELDHGLYAKEENISFSSWFEIWLEVYKSAHVKRGTMCLYRDIYNRYLKDTLGNRKLKDIRVDNIQKIYNELYSNGYSGNTIELVSTVLQGMYKQAIKNNIVKENPVYKATLPKIKRAEFVKAMTLEEQDTFIRFSKDSKLHDLFKMALYTGLRSGELRGLEWKNVDFDNKIIHVRKTLLFINHDYFLDDPKTESSKRDVPMVESLWLILKQHRINQNKQRLMMGDNWRPKNGLEDLVFTTDTGYPINRDVLKVEVNRIVAKINDAGIKYEHITPHYWRHTFATRCLELGMGYKTLQTILGHSKLSMTMDLYAHVLPNTKAAEMEKIDGMIG